MLMNTLGIVIIISIIILYFILTKRDFFKNSFLFYNPSLITADVIVYEKGSPGDKGEQGERGNNKFENKNDEGIFSEISKIFSYSEIICKDNSVPNYTGNTINSFKNSTLNQCKVECERNENCEGLLWDNDKKTCELKKNINKEDLLNPAKDKSFCYKSQNIEEITQNEDLKTTKCSHNYDSSNKFKKGSCSKDKPICKNEVCISDKQANYLKNNGCKRSMDNEVDENQHNKCTSEAPICVKALGKQHGRCASQKQINQIKNIGCARDMNRTIDAYQHDKCTAAAPICFGYKPGQWGGCTTLEQSKKIKSVGCFYDNKDKKEPNWRTKYPSEVKWMCPSNYPKCLKPKGGKPGVCAKQGEINSLKKNQCAKNLNRNPVSRHATGDAGYYCINPDKPKCFNYKANHRWGTCRSEADYNNLQAHYRKYARTCATFIFWGRNARRKYCDPINMKYGSPL